MASSESIRVAALLSISCLVTACHITGGYSRLGPGLAPREPECAIAVIEGELQRAHTAIGEVHARDGRGRRVAVLIPELKRQACLLGASAIVGIEYKVGREAIASSETVRFKSASPAFKQMHRDTFSPTSPVSIARAIAVVIEDDVEMRTRTDGDRADR